MTWNVEPPVVNCRCVLLPTSWLHRLRFRARVTWRWLRDLVRTVWADGWASVWFPIVWTPALWPPPFTQRDLEYLALRQWNRDVVHQALGLTHRRK